MNHLRCLHRYQEVGARISVLDFTLEWEESLGVDLKITTEANLVLQIKLINGWQIEYHPPVCNYIGWRNNVA